MACWDKCDHEQGSEGHADERDKGFLFVGAIQSHDFPFFIGRGDADVVLPIHGAAMHPGLKERGGGPDDAQGEDEHEEPERITHGEYLVPNLRDGFLLATAKPGKIHFSKFFDIYRRVVLFFLLRP